MEHDINAIYWITEDYNNLAWLDEREWSQLQSRDGMGDCGIILDPDHKTVIGFQFDNPDSEMISIILDFIGHMGLTLFTPYDGDLGMNADARKQFDQMSYDEFNNHWIRKIKMAPGEFD